MSRNSSTLVSNDTPRMIIFRVPDGLKMDFRLALIRHHLDMQHTMEAFIEQFVEYDKSDTGNKTFEKIIERSQALMEGV